MIFFTQADAHLRYTPQHKPLFLQLPNMKTIKMTVSFSSVVFKTVTEICRTLSVFLLSFLIAVSLLYVSAAIVMIHCAFREKHP